MAKKRKTREEKIATSEKRQFSPQQITYSFPSASPTSPLIPIAKQHAQTTTHTPLDLQKTFSISLTLIVLELILYFLLHHHILKLPFAQY